MHPDIIGMAYSAVDYLGIVPRYPDFDSKMELLEFSKQGGGPAATAMVTVARLGAKASYVGKVGDDDFGRFILARLEREGVRTDRVIVQPGVSSPFAFIIVDKETGKRTILWTRSGVSPLLPEELDRDYMRLCKVLLVDGHDIATACTAADWANEAGIPVVYDAGSVRPGTDELVKRTDYLAASEVYVRQLMGNVDPATAAERLLQGRCRLAAVTLGDKGAVYATPNGVFTQPAFKVDAVDTTGAGDVFHGALAFGVFKRWPDREIIEFAAAIAAMKCTELGGRPGIPTLPQALRFLRERSDNPFW